MPNGAEYCERAEWCRKNALSPDLGSSHKQRGSERRREGRKRDEVGDARGGGKGGRGMKLERTMLKGTVSRSLIVSQAEGKREEARRDEEG